MKDKQISEEEESNKKKEETTAKKKKTTKKKEDKTAVELAELKDKYTRLYAEFDNYKKRAIKERSDFLKTAGSDLVLSILPVLDDFERAWKSIDKQQDATAIKEGFQLIHSKLKDNLQHKGLKEMESVNQVFNADFHEAITEIPMEDEQMKGKIVDELEKGYLFNNKVIRFAKVVVAK